VEYQENALQKTISFVKSYRYLFIIWSITISVLYWDNIVHYPNSIVDKYHLNQLYDYFDYVDDYAREQEALAYAKSQGKYWEGKALITMGFRFLRPVPNIWKFISLLVSPIIWLFIAVYTGMLLHQFAKKNKGRTLS
jgi:hypothetical protein